VRSPVDLRGHRSVRARSGRRDPWGRSPRWSGRGRFDGRLVAIAAVVAIGVASIAAFALLHGRGGDPTTAPPPTTAPAGPRVLTPARVGPSTPGHVNALRGLVDPGTSLTADGAPVTLEVGGAFTIYIPQGATEIHLLATDASGASAAVNVAVTAHPAPVAHPHTVAVHVRPEEWADPTVHGQIVAMARSGVINAVELDVKDEAGEVGYASKVPLATTVGAVRARYDARAATAELHELGMRVVGRIVCFLDPVTAAWAWSHQRPDMVVLDGAGTAPLKNGYGAAVFTNFANPEVRAYQIDLAREAASLGFDDLLYDYVRRPEGDLNKMRFTGLEGAPAVSVARFVADTHDALDGTGADLGVSVFGIAATRPAAIGQDVALLAPNVDYVAPMVYPSHWGPGEYGVADPVHQPAEIVAASLADFSRIVAGSGAAIVPWLQDFSTEGAPYGPNEVRAQVGAAAKAGADGFLLWNPGSTYHADALTRLAAQPATTVSGAAGQTTTPSAAPSGSSTPAAVRFHAVQEGDTLTAIASKYGVDVAAIRELNAIADPDALTVGQVLQVPPAAAG
jgi:hypothetical protein